MPAGITVMIAGNDDLDGRLRTLTPQQARVLGLVAEGLLNKQIAHELNVAEATVKAHVSAILQKLGVGSRAEAAGRLAIASAARAIA